MNTVLICLFR